MTLSDTLFLTPAESSDDGVAAPNRAPSPAWRLWLAILFVACLIPRVAMAWRLETVSDDSYYYMGIARALAEGDYTTAFEFLSINVYPVILLGLHSLGIDWIVAGKLWGVVVSTLIVLPLAALVRRVFNERTAIVAGFLYIIHPNLIELSVEPVREGTFWFLFVLSLDIIHRATAEKSLAWFLAAGTGFTLAVHTRVEGWFLGIALAGWCYCEWRRERRNWIPLCRGLLVFAAVTPLFLVAVNVGLLRDHDRWEWGRMHEVRIFRDYVMQTLGVPSGAASDPKSPATTIEFAPSGKSTTGELRRISVTAAVPQFCRQMLYAVEPMTIVLVAAGLFFLRRSVLRGDVLPLSATGFALIAAVAVRLVFINDINGRYFLTPLLCLLPFAAHALRQLSSMANDWLGKRQVRGSGPAFAGCVVSVVALVGLADALSASHVRRSQELALGRWLGDRLPTGAHVLVDRPSTRLAYEMCGDLPRIFLKFTPAEIDRTFSARVPDLLVVSTRKLPPGHYDEAVRRAESFGMSPLTLEGAPDSARDFVILVRDPATRAAARPPHDAARTAGESPSLR